MKFLRKLFDKKDNKVFTNKDFWEWFQNNEKEFFKIVKNHEKIQSDFFDKLSPKLEALREGYFFLAGMLDENTAELIITADGNILNIAFVEDLINDAPNLKNWKFTALKPAMDIPEFSIKMDEYVFDNEHLFFYYNEYANYPDEIDICIIHKDLNENNRSQIVNGTYIFLDNYLGELKFIEDIDSIEILEPSEAEKDLIPIGKLKEFLNWRQKEFVEKYEGDWYTSDSDSYSMLTAELEDGNNLLAVVNSNLLNWDKKASHPWVAIVTIKYDGTATNGMPTSEDLSILNQIEDEISELLKDHDGYLNVGRQTAQNKRELYFVCKDFRKPSKVLSETKKTYQNQFEIDINIYKDKYWRTFERFNKR
ncbi:MAG: DUF695 domain-containing protein [Cytophagales bacterium]